MILIDPRVGTKRGMTRSERLERMITILKSRVNCPVRAAKPMLKSGDVAFEGNGPNGTVDIGIELKEIRDLCGAMRGDRLAGDQLVKMSDMYSFVFLIVEGLWRPASDDKLETFSLGRREWRMLDLAPKNSRFVKAFRYGEVLKFLVSLNTLKNVMVLRSSTEDETIWQIAHLYAWWQRDWDAHRSTDPVKVQTENLFVRSSDLRKFAKELDGIGWARSKAVDEHFRSIHEAVNAPVEAWESIPGIGPKLARDIWNRIRKRNW